MLMDLVQILWVSGVMGSAAGGSGGIGFSGNIKMQISTKQ
jgi:hypothetical protein